MKGEIKQMTEKEFEALTKIYELFRYYELDARSSAAICGSMLFQLYKNHGNKDQWCQYLDDMKQYWDLPEYIDEPKHMDSQQ